MSTSSFSSPRACDELASNPRCKGTFVEVPSPAIRGTHPVRRRLWLGAAFGCGPAARPPIDSRHLRAAWRASGVSPTFRSGRLVRGSGCSGMARGRVCQPVVASLCRPAMIRRRRRGSMHRRCKHLEHGDERHQLDDAAGGSPTRLKHTLIHPGRARRDGSGHRGTILDALEPRIGGPAPMAVGTSGTCQRSTPLRPIMRLLCRPTTYWDSWPRTAPLGNGWVWTLR
jgi:hypothetical protein